jgi:SAM-dependent methyltransferase
MTRARSAFAGGDQRYLREEQYRNSDRLKRRATLHAKYSTATVPWHDWVGSIVDLRAGDNVLEVGCGAGWLWQRFNGPIPARVTLTLTDLSPGMVNEAVGRVGATARFASLAGYQADAQALPFDDQSFDRVVANHMLYHLPDPVRGVNELARVTSPSGLVFAATNGRRHMQQLWAIRHEVFDLPAVDATLEVFGVETGFPILRDHFGRVGWIEYRDELHCTDPEDVVAYLCSTPPAEDATPEQLARVRAAILEAFAADHGSMTITKDTGCFVCTEPRPR